jgi:leucyl/phenylalanyl-tRNA--protein transferase
MTSLTLMPELLLQAYSNGLFPMAESASSAEIFWVSPEKRGVLPLNNFHIPKRLKRTIRQDVFHVRADDDVERTIRLCAAPKAGRRSTWINDDIIRVYTDLHESGFCHAIDVYDDQNTLVGGLYGVSMGGVFFGESMFSTMRDASKVALVHLVGRLKAGGYKLLDTQFITDHLRQFGAVEIPKVVYLKALKKALTYQGRFDVWPSSGVSGAEVLQSVSHTS